jgi:hypothetical protein
MGIAPIEAKSSSTIGDSPIEECTWRRFVHVEISSNVIVIAVNLIVGTRLLKQGVDRGALPELLLGGTLAFDGLEWLSWMLAFYTPLAETPLAPYLTIACRGGILLSNLCLLLFVRAVFRPSSSLALVFALGVSLTSWIGLTVGIYLGDWSGFAADRIWLWLELTGTLIAYVWCLSEATAYYANMRKRARHGLADPIVTNRVLLWSGYAAAGAVTELVYMVAIAMGAAAGAYPFIFDAIMIATTTAGGMLVVLAFFPPPIYLRWVAGNAALATDSR